MDAQGFLWRHVIINTKGSWLHGDPRGFRSREHRIHSSGDYNHPPPEAEHRLLHDYMRRKCPGAVTLSAHLRVPVLRKLVGRLKKEPFEVLTGSVGEQHAHLLVRLPDNLPVIRAIVGRCKRDACEAVKHEMTGSIWSAGGDFVPVETREHHRRVYRYIYEEQEPQACTWSYKDDVYREPRA